MVAQDLRGGFRYEDLRGIVDFCAGAGQSRHLPGNLRTKMPSTEYHKIFFIRLERLYTAERLVRSEGIARGSKA